MQFYDQMFLFSGNTYYFSSMIFSTGLSDVLGEAMVKLYCPKCQLVFTPRLTRHHNIDGVYFNTGFPHMLFMVPSRIQT